MGRRTLLSRKNRTTIIESVIKNIPDEQIAKKLKINKGTLAGYFSRGLVPKRKEIRRFVIFHHLSIVSRLTHYGSEIRLFDLAQLLNHNGIFNQVSKMWTTENLKGYLSKVDVSITKRKVRISELEELKVDHWSFYRLFSLSPCDLDIQEYLLEDLSDQEVSAPAVVPTVSLYVSSLREHILKAQEQGAKTAAEVTTILNENGVKNQQGKPFGRWSVIQIMEKLSILPKVTKKEWGAVEKQTLLAKIATHNKNKLISEDTLKQWISSLETETVLLTNKQTLYNAVSPLRVQHNKRVRVSAYYKKWFPKIDYIVNVTFRYKSASREDIASELGVCPMTAHRVLTKLEYNVKEQYFIRFKILYRSYLEQTKDQEWSYENCVKWFNSTYLKSERGSDWSYQILQYSIDKLYSLEDRGLCGFETAK